MTKTVLVINTGSSSLKASLLCETMDKKDDPETKSLVRIITAHGERLSTKDSFLHICMSKTAVDSIICSSNKHNLKKLSRGDSLPLTSRATRKQSDHADTDADVDDIELREEYMTHKRAIELVIENMKNCSEIIASSICAVGHRVVHGGASFSDAVIVNPHVISTIESVSHLAPLHNPSNLEGIRIAIDVFKDIPSIAVFDTAFHSTMESHVYNYPLPKEYIDCNIRKYGFHGTSVKYVSSQAINILRSKGLKHRTLIVAHLGNGASCTAIVDGKSVDTTMEFSPLSGLMMGTRSGTVDPTIVTYAAQQLNKTHNQVIDDMNKRSGLKGVCGDNDMRVIISRANDGDEDAILAFEMFIYILTKHLAGLIVACGGTVDALIFTAGIGEHSSLVRSKVVNKIGRLLGNASICDEWNEHDGTLSDGIISNIPPSDAYKGNSTTVLMVIPTDEEKMIFHECHKLLKFNDDAQSI